MENEKLFERIYLESKLKSRLTENEYEQLQEGKLKNALIGLSILGATLGMASCANGINVQEFDNQEKSYEWNVEDPENFIKFTPVKDNSLTKMLLNNLDKTISSNDLIDELEDYNSSGRAASSSRLGNKVKPSSGDTGTSTIGLSAPTEEVGGITVKPGDYNKMSKDNVIDTIPFDTDLLLSVTTKPDEIKKEGLFLKLGDTDKYILILGKYAVPEEGRAASSSTLKDRQRDYTHSTGDSEFTLVDGEGDIKFTFNSTDVDEAEETHFYDDTSFSDLGIIFYSNY